LAHINTLGDLVQKTEAEMLKYRNFGRKSLSEMIEKIESKGLRFGMNVEGLYPPPGQNTDEDSGEDGTENKGSDTDANSEESKVMESESEVKS
jgi:hypothetical protein